MLDLLGRYPELLHCRDDGGDPLLLSALIAGQSASADVLLRYGAPLCSASAAILGRVDELESMLQSEPATVRDRTSDGWTLLHLAAMAGQAQVCRLLIHRDADIDDIAPNSSGATPLCEAVRTGDLDTVQVLVEAGAAHAPDAFGRSPRMLAEQAGRADLLSVLAAAREVAFDDSNAIDDPETEAVVAD